MHIQHYDFTYKNRISGLRIEGITLSKFCEQEFSRCLSRKAEQSNLINPLRHFLMFNGASKKFEIQIMNKNTLVLNVDEHKAKNYLSNGLCLSFEELFIILEGENE